MKRQFIYAVCFDNGLLKIGRTSNVRMRMQCLKTATGFRIQKAVAVECDWFSANKTESNVLSWARRVGCGYRNSREMFENLSFGSVANRLRQIGHKNSLHPVKTTWGDGPPRKWLNIPSRSAQP